MKWDEYERCSLQYLVRGRSLGLLLGRKALRRDDLGEHLTLLLGAAVGAQALLGKLQRTLVKTVAQQLHKAPLVRRKADHLADNLLSQRPLRVVMALVLLPGNILALALRHHEALLEPNDEAEGKLLDLLGRGHTATVVG